MADEVRSNLLSRFITILRVRMLHTNNHSIYHRTNNTDAKKCDDEEKDKQDDRSNNAY